MNTSQTIRFTLGGIVFEYDEDKNNNNIKKHGISFRSAARVFFDYDRIEMFDEANSIHEDRYDTIGDISAGYYTYGNSTVIGNIGPVAKEVHDVVFVVYTERRSMEENGQMIEITRLISARMATGFERGLYYGKHE